MSLRLGNGGNIDLIDRYVDPHHKIDRDVFLEYLLAANRLADALCTDRLVHHPKREKERSHDRNTVVFAYDNVTFRWSPSFRYTTRESNQIDIRFVKCEYHDRKYPFAEIVSMEASRNTDSEYFHKIATLHGNGISLESGVNSPDILGSTEPYIEDIEEFVFAMRMALSSQIGTQAAAEAS